MVWDAVNPRLKKLDRLKKLMKKVKQVMHGGRRVGSGRKRNSDPLVTYSVHISTAHADLLKAWGGGDLSAGLRWLVGAAKVFVRG